MKTNCRNLFLLLLVLNFVSAQAQVPVLNSNPSASAVVFLDFDGHTAEGTSWNGNGPLVCGPAALNAAQITTVFNRVAEDYRPFTLNITTDSARFQTAPLARRMRVVLTVSSSWYGLAGGVAYMNSFTWGDNTPCFVFTALLNNNLKNIAEAASHEIGHTLGLRHQSSYDAVCNKTSEYNAGQGSGEIGWAPIMGVGYYQNMTLWNYGANPFGCNAFQDDLSIITGNDNGIDYRTDDYEGTTAGARLATVVNDTFALAGIIEKPGDEDAVKFLMPLTGTLSLQAVPYAVATGNTGANLDMEIELLSNDGTVLAVYNPAASLSTTVDTTLSAGTYYLRVRGRGNVYAPNYASLGSYTLTAALKPGAALPVHKLQLRGAAENKQHKLSWEIVADENVVRQMIETATDGNGFQQLADAGQTAREYTHANAGNGLSYYRIKVVFENGRTHYSNTVALRSNNGGGKPSLVGSATNGTLTVNSPSAYRYAVVDMAGRVLQRGNLVQGLNIVPANFQGHGLYLIQFDNGKESHAEKFSRP